MRPSTRILTGTIALLTTLAATVAIGLWGSSRLDAGVSNLEHGQTLTDDAMQVKFRAADFNGWQTAYAFDIKRGVPGAAADTADSRKAFLASADAFSKEIAALQHDTLNTSQLAAARTADAAFRQFMQVDAEVVRDYRHGTPVSIKAADDLVLGKEIELFTTTATNVDRLIASVRATASSDRRDATTVMGQVTIAIYAAATVAALLAIAVVFTLRRAIVGVRRVVEVIGDAAGDLAAVAEQASASATEVGTAVNETARAIESVAVGAERQTQMLVEATQDAATARDRATSGMGVSEAIDAAMQGMRSSSDEVGEAMGALARRSEEITSIVDTITTIADQTALLALNAAIEAARAGEHGRGFAVVADEVRHLADKSRESTGSITRLVEEIRSSIDRAEAISSASAGQVSTGVEIAQQSHDAFAAIQQGADQIDAVLHAIALVGADTSAAAQQVSAAAEETSASVHEVSSAATSVAETAELLKAIVSDFRF